jgi:glutamate-1-semialdehyde aminotransferase
MMAKNRRARFTYAEDRHLIQMAAASATLEEAAATFKTTIKTIERKAEKLGIRLKRRADDQGLKVKK